MIDALTNEFAVDTDRLYITGLSLGGYGSWDYIVQNPDRYAAAIPMSGGASLNASLATRINRIAIWNFHAVDDGTVDVLNSQSAITTLRRAGGNPVYTEYASGGHVIWTPAYSTPGLMDWVYSQRRGVPSSTEPVVRFAKPTADAVWKTGSTNLAVSGTARALGQAISTMTLVNYANNARGVTFAGNAWDAGAVPIKANTTNILSVLARTTSWYAPFGGSTTFTASLFVIQSPLSARYLRQGGGLTLDWSGGGPPYRVQFAPGLGDAWTDYIPNGTPPLPLPSSPGTGFYRVVGQ
jgi:hypothetical protein